MCWCLNHLQDVSHHFRGFGLGELRAILDTFVIITCKKGTVIWTEGDRTQCFCFLLSGESTCVESNGKLKLVLDVASRGMLKIEVLTTYMRMNCLAGGKDSGLVNIGKYAMNSMFDCHRHAYSNDSLRLG